MKLIFMRHGEAEHNLAGWRGPTGVAELTSAGRKAVAQAGRQLNKLRVVAVYVSPLIRARQTAEIVIATWKQPPKIEVDSRLADTDDRWAALDSKAWHRWRWPSARRRAGNQSAGQELGFGAQPVTGFLADIRQKHAGARGAILIVAHLYTLRQLVQNLHHGFLAVALDKNYSLPPAGWVQLQPCDCEPRHLDIPDSLTSG